MNYYVLIDGVDFLAWDFGGFKVQNCEFLRSEFGRS